MMRIAVATYEGNPRLTYSDSLIVPLLAKKDVEVIPVPWSARVNWREYALVLIRSPWDYHLNYRKFIGWIASLESQQIPVWNTPATLRWNSEKTYINTLPTNSVAVVPTIIIRNADDIPKKLPWNEAVLKPSIGASSYGVVRIGGGATPGFRATILKLLSRGTILVQEYQPQIKEGEYSFIFFDKVFSHAVLKTPSKNEFRVQSEFGGKIIPVMPPDQVTKQIQQLLAAIPDPLLYARVDGFVHAGHFTLLELELCEPELFLDTDPAAPQRFVEAIIQRL